MRILCILENPLDIDVARNALANFAESDSIFFAHNFYDANVFIDKKIVNQQQPLD